MKMKKVNQRNKRLFHGLQKTKRSINVQGKWKAVELDPSLFAEEGMEDLVCFEELTDYRMLDSEQTAVEAEKEPKKNKKAKEDVEHKEADVTVAPPKKKTKKKKTPEDFARVAVDKQVPHEEVIKCGKPTRSNPEIFTKSSKKIKKRKVESSIQESHSEQVFKKEKLTREKMSKPVKKQQQKKNWTEAVLNCCNDTTTDVSAWKGLFVPTPVLKALSSLGFGSPTPIQALTLPSAIRDHMDILGAAETGSGKTLAFGIPMIHTILEWKKNSHRRHKSHIAGGKSDLEDTAVAELNPAGSQSLPLLGLVLTPTRELAVQVKHHIDVISKFTDIKTAIVVGGMSQEKQRKMLKRSPEIVIATPGRLWDLIREKHPHLQNLRQVRCLVIDEADRMVERGHFAELEGLFEMLKTTYFNPLRQMFVFSATLTMKRTLPTRLLQRRNLDQRSRLEILIDKVGIKAKPKIVDLTRKEATVETLTETRIHCQKDEKDFYLYYFLTQYPGRTMVFANSIDCIKRLNCLLVILNCDPLPLHANMHQKQRLKNLERFAQRDSCVLLTTDVAARGLDLPDVQHVIHYHVPRTSETYVHRSGRTARATKEGLSLLLIGPEDMINFKKITKTLGKDEELPVFPIETKCMEAIKDRVNLARQIEKIEFHNNRKKHHNSWLKQAAEDLEIDLDDDLLIGKGKDEEQDREQQMMVKGMKKHLKHLISQPVFKNVMKTKYPTQMGKLCLPQAALAGMENALSVVSVQERKKKFNQSVPSQQKKGGKKQ
uniref:ATP-dependent RNA helicase n=1 Tax=Tetraodon nigroviridis TaxID=99883 RepID=H3DJ12_TETNG